MNGARLVQAGAKLIADTNRMRAIHITAIHGKEQAIVNG
jgi:hypothetical protein